MYVGTIVTQSVMFEPAGGDVRSSNILSAHTEQSSESIFELGMTSPVSLNLPVCTLPKMHSKMLTNVLRYIYPVCNGSTANSAHVFSDETFYTQSQIMVENAHVCCLEIEIHMIQMNIHLHCTLCLYILNTAIVTLPFWLICCNQPFGLDNFVDTRYMYLVCQYMCKPRELVVRLSPLMQSLVYVHT